MFENLTEKLNKVFKTLKGQGKLTEKNIQDALREVRLALLEADVHYKVAKNFVAAIKERAIGQEVLSSLTPGQQVIKIVNEELTRLLGEEAVPLDLMGRPPICLMVVGLQGSGKTTTAAKLASYLKKSNHRPCMVAADVYRPAAIDQLATLGKQIGVPVYADFREKNPEKICSDALNYAKQEGNNILIVDTAGRLHIDTELMEELQRLKNVLDPNEVLFVADAMTGQDAVNVASEFDNELGITGVILTKMDGDARGGAALSIREVTGKPIKFIGTGEKIDALEVFYPDRMSSRILGMGDVLTLIEKAQESFDEKQALDLARKIRDDSFTLEDFRDQLRQVRKLGSLEQILSMLPGMSNLKQMKNFKVDEKELVRVEAIINSMTPEERRNHSIINASRRRRIARGSGTSIQDVNRLLKNYVQAKKMMRQLTGGGKKGKRKRIRKTKSMLPWM